MYGVGTMTVGEAMMARKVTVAHARSEEVDT
jgi:hypothetical protein